MTWTAPTVIRVDDDKANVADERYTLEDFLNWYRGTLLHKCAGLSGEQLAIRPVPSSSLSLLGLVRHATGAERAWFRRRFGGEEIGRPYGTDETPDAAFDDADPAEAEGDFATFTREVELCRAATAGRSLDETFVNPRNGKTMSLRWIYVHMIEEYARHCGHADLIRELIDGTTGG